MIGQRNEFKTKGKSRLLATLADYANCTLSQGGLA